MIAGQRDHVQLSVRRQERGRAHRKTVQEFGKLRPWLRHAHQSPNWERLKLRAKATSSSIELTMATFQPIARMRPRYPAVSCPHLDEPSASGNSKTNVPPPPACLIASAATSHPSRPSDWESSIENISLSLTMSM